MKRSLFGAVAVAVVALTAVLIGTASAAKPPSASNASGCPNGGTYLVDSDVGASFAGDTIRTYTFHSWVDKNPVGGVPGLVGYCVYTNQTAGDVTATAKGDNEQLWKASKAGPSFSYTRPGGEKSNIGLDGTDTVIGTAKFNTSPGSETILLHVSDAAKCQALYGGDATTCFVKPAPKPGPICNAGTGNADAAYNAIPTDVEDCSPPSYAFEGNFANEFGDEVLLDTTGGDGSGGVSLRVDFQSYGCGDSGHWYNPQCATTSGDTFQVPGGITAKIYDDSLNLIATSATINPNIPFRPSAVPDAGNCPNPPPSGYPADSRFKNPVSGLCSYSLSVPLTFTFPNHTFTSGQDVVWTVQFNTSHAGYAPIVTNLPAEPCILLDQGCGYDSLNVGAKTYAPDAFAGTDVDENEVFVSTGNPDFSSPLVPLAAETGWTGYRPLGEIVLG